MANYGAFSIRALNSLVRELQHNPSVMENDWVETTKNTFSMTEQQKALLDSCPAELHNQVQEHFSKAADNVQNGGTVQLKVVMEDPDTRALYLMSSRPGSRQETALGIICCNANCGDWEWCFEN